jgi:hypothetical protein
MPTLTVSALKETKLYLFSRKVSDDGIAHPGFEASCTQGPSRIKVNIIRSPDEGKAPVTETFWLKDRTMGKVLKILHKCFY